MSDINEIINGELADGISRIQRVLDSAKGCLRDEDYFQCAVRFSELQEEIVKINGSFNDFTMLILDNVSGGTDS